MLLTARSSSNACRFCSSRSCRARRCSINACASSVELAVMTSAQRRTFGVTTSSPQRRRTAIAPSLRDARQSPRPLRRSAGHFGWFARHAGCELLVASGARRAVVGVCPRSVRHGGGCAGRRWHATSGSRAGVLRPRASRRACRSVGGVQQSWPWTWTRPRHIRAWRLHPGSSLALLRQLCGGRCADAEKRRARRCGTHYRADGTSRRDAAPDRAD